MMPLGRSELRRSWSGQGRRISRPPARARPTTSEAPGRPHLRAVGCNSKSGDPPPAYRAACRSRLASPSMRECRPRRSGPRSSRVRSAVRNEIDAQPRRRGLPLSRVGNCCSVHRRTRDPPRACVYRSLASDFLGSADCRLPALKRSSLIACGNTHVRVRCRPRDEIAAKRRSRLPARSC